MKAKRIDFVIILTLIFCMFFQFVSFSASCSKLRKEVLRLHIIANSDSLEDQNLKLKIRDAVIKESGVYFNSVSSYAQAKAAALRNLGNIQALAQRVIDRSGESYHAKVMLGKAFFETRYYENVTLPAGEYEAVKIILGKGKGHNWWCVMFPQLCLGACDNMESLNTLSEEERKLILSNPNFEVRFKCVEVYEKIKNIWKKEN